MMARGILLGLLAAMIGAAAFHASAPVSAQRDTAFGGDTTQAAQRSALQRARREAREAKTRGDRLEKRARESRRAVDKTAQAAAVLAARIQEAEAGIAAAQARMTLIGEQRRRLDRRLAVRQEPLVRLTGALQKMARRPLALSALSPGSLRDTVYLRAILETTVPQVRERTIALRAEIARGQALQREARQAVTALRSSEGQLKTRRTALAALESRQRLEARAAGGDANRETERALALAEEARDLDALLDELDKAGTLRAELAALDGPVLRPADTANLPSAQNDTDSAPTPSAGTRSTGAPSAASPPPRGLQLPVAGRTVAGFGEPGASGVRAAGISFAPRDGAQVVTPAAGRVAFAGPYRGFDRIVIIEHPNGWTSLITGLSRSDVAVGETLLGGAPLGVAGVADPVVTFELRRSGVPVNPVDFIR